MRTNTRIGLRASRGGWPWGLALALACAAGCENTPPGAGFTNPNAGSADNRDKAASRVDLPVPDAGTKGEPVSDSASSVDKPDLSGATPAPKAAGTAPTGGSTKPTDPGQAGTPK